MGVLSYYQESVGYAHIQSPLCDVEFKFTQAGDSVKIEVKVLEDFKDIYSVYPFHIHEAPVNGDCASTKRHLDPQEKNPNGNFTGYKCVNKDFSTCEVGDLSGKFGKLKGEKDEYIYFDHSLQPVKDLVGVRSVVVHLDDAAKTRIGCATIEGNEY